MIGGRRLLVSELMIIINRIQRLDRSDPMGAIEEQELVNVLLCERRYSAVPLGEAAFPQLEAPGGPLGRHTQPASGAQRDPRRAPPRTSSAQIPNLGHPAHREDDTLPNPHPQPGPSVRPTLPSAWAKTAKDVHLGLQGPRVDYAVSLPVFQEFVDLTGETEEGEDMEDAPATPSPNVSTDGSEKEMDWKKASQ